MYDELVQCTQEGEIEIEEIPKVATIQNWISHYIQEHKQETAARGLN